MNRFTVKLLRGVITGIIYLLSIYCFLNTNIYSSMLSYINPKIITLVVMNIPVIFFVLMALISRKDLSNAVLRGSILFLLPGVISVSKFNWVERLFGIKLSSSIYPGLLAILCYLVLIMLIIGRLIERFDSNMDILLEHGADNVELQAVQEKQYMVYAIVGAAVTLPVSVTAIIGFFILQPQKTGNEPIIFLLSGIFIAALCVWICVSGLNKKQ